MKYKYEVTKRPEGKFLSGRKANTVRLNLPDWKKKKLKEATHIKIRKGYTKEFFIRKITDKTYWEGIYIISWDSGEK